MSKNYIEKVAQMLGVEMGEVFRVKNFGNRKFYINENGLQCSDLNISGRVILSDLLLEHCELVKIPKRKHTGIEDIVEGDKIYPLFGLPDGMIATDNMMSITEYFSDEEIRDNWERYIRIKIHLAKAASELNTAPIDWDDCRQEKWFICCRDHETLTCHYIDCGADEGVFFTSEEAARKAIEIVGKDDLIWMLRDFQAFIGYLVEVAE